MITVVLVRPEKPENIGFVARAMANFGLRDLIIINPLCNPLDENSLKTSKHAQKVLRNSKICKTNYYWKLKNHFKIVAGTSSIICTDYNIPRSPILPEDFVKKIKNTKTALVFGNEGTGLSNTEINYCDFIITIPTSEKYRAMNLSHSASIIFYELFKNKGTTKLKQKFRPATNLEKQIILKKLEQITQKLNFSTEQKKNTQLLAWKKIFEKSMMTKRESFVIMGLLKKVDDKLSKP